MKLSEIIQSILGAILMRNKEKEPHNIHYTLQATKEVFGYTEPITVNLRTKVAQQQPEELPDFEAFEWVLKSEGGSHREKWKELKPVFPHTHEYSKYLPTQTARTFLFMLPINMWRKKVKHGSFQLYLRKSSTDEILASTSISIQPCTSEERDLLRKLSWACERDLVHGLTGRPLKDLEPILDLAKTTRVPLTPYLSLLLARNDSRYWSTLEPLADNFPKPLNWLVKDHLYWNEEHLEHPILLPKDEIEFRFWSDKEEFTYEGMVKFSLQKSNHRVKYEIYDCENEAWNQKGEGYYFSVETQDEKVQRRSQITEQPDSDREGVVVFKGDVKDGHFLTGVFRFRQNLLTLFGLTVPVKRNQGGQEPGSAVGGTSTSSGGTSGIKGEPPTWDQ